jgi:alkanesulfonate monooxygenase SsuD/methylene tetrahydromethanopterin reductase-like flavin-dependent oxidoreductase (luciferase family)
MSTAAVTLDHLTNGRIGWNVVTGYLPSAARNFGAADQPDHDDRYDQADEYLEMLYKLWEGSKEDDAVVRDAARGVYVDPAKVHHIGHYGRHYTVPGIHLGEPSPQRTPVIYQAGASPRGTRSAAENAEAIFVAAPSKRVLAQMVSRIRAALEAAGRDMGPVFTGSGETIADLLQEWSAATDVDGCNLAYAGRRAASPTLSPMSSRCSPHEEPTRPTTPRGRCATRCSARAIDSPTPIAARATGSARRVPPRRRTRWRGAAVG